MKRSVELIKLFPEKMECAVKRFIFNLGYDISHVTSLLSSEGLETSSEVVLIIPEGNDKRQENAVKDVRNYLDRINAETSLTCFEASKNIERNVSKFSKLFSSNRKTIVSLSGGPRDHLIPLTLAAAASGSEVDKFYFRSDLDSDLEQISVPEFSPELSETQKQILETVEERYVPVSEIAENTDYSESTVYDRVSGLVSKNLLLEKSIDGSSRYKCTDSARILLDPIN
ncbi:CRISPR locus-related DNA-binding protein [Nanohaloarchaea archaeon]|nr:CRISPR locus-related DNA-binding protein [Candidatus Nanohaloarchaea archaeon]